MVERYRQVYSEKKDKQWSSAKRFYQLAIGLSPEQGHSFNQLAVISAHEGNDLSAVEMYFQSLSVKHPFPTAMDNLLLLFQKSTKRLSNGHLDSIELLLSHEFISLVGTLFGESCR